MIEKKRSLMIKKKKRVSVIWLKHLFAVAQKFDSFQFK